MMSVVREFPPRDSCRIRVSLESRYGMYLTCAHIDDISIYYIRSLGKKYAPWGLLVH